MEAIAIVIQVMLIIMVNFSLTIAGIIIGLVLLQLISYKIFNFNLYKKVKYVLIDSQIK